MAQTDRVLIEIVTAANMTGIKEAQAGMLGMNSAMTAAIAGLGILAVAGKSIVDITEQRQKADSDLAQALKAQGQNTADANAFLNTFLDTNRAFYSSQSEVVESYAQLVRSGLPAAEVQKDMNRALDLAALKNISVEDATQLLIAAEHGRTRGLIDLGITTTKYTDAQGNVINQGKNMALVMAEIDAKTAHGRETTTQMTQATNNVSNDWQDIANTVGPSLVEGLDLVAKAADDIFHALKNLGENKDWASAVDKVFGGWQDLILGIVDDVKTLIGWLQGAGDLINKAGNIFSGSGQKSVHLGPIHAATGFEGGVSQPTMFLAGEGVGAEHVSIGPTGGGRGGVTVNVDLRGAFLPDGPSIDRLTNLIAQRLTTVSGY